MYIEAKGIFLRIYLLMLHISKKKNIYIIIILVLFKLIFTLVLEIFLLDKNGLSDGT